MQMRLSRRASTRHRASLLIEASRSLSRGTSVWSPGCPLRFGAGGPMFAPWWKFSTDAVMLAVEAQGVIAMRLTSIALGRGTHAENARMLSEKTAAFAEAAMTLAAGGSPHEVVRGYRKHVRANGRRLRR